MKKFLLFTAALVTLFSCNKTKEELVVSFGCEYVDCGSITKANDAVRDAIMADIDSKIRSFEVQRVSDLLTYSVYPGGTFKMEPGVYKVLPRTEMHDGCTTQPSYSFDGEQLINIDKDGTYTVKAGIISHMIVVDKDGLETVQVVEFDRNTFEVIEGLQWIDIADKYKFIYCTPELTNKGSVLYEFEKRTVTVVPLDVQQYRVTKFTTTLCKSGKYYILSPKVDSRPQAAFNVDYTIEEGVIEEGN